jgi:hypothetical protein
MPTVVLLSPMCPSFLCCGGLHSFRGALHRKETPTPSSNFQTLSACAPAKLRLRVVLHHLQKGREAGRSYLHA